MKRVQGQEANKLKLMELIAALTKNTNVYQPLHAAA